MAETTDRRAESADPAAPIPAAPPVPAGEAPRPYSSLSLLAVGGFALAVVYAALMAAGGLIALFNHTPWILPLWSFVVPLGVAAVCWAGRTQVRNSEGALGGARLAAWGVGLSLAVGVVYAAYYGGSYAAVTSQAVEATDRWVDLMKKGQTDQAFLMALPPPRPAADANLRDRLELEFDRGSPQTGGQFTQFRQGELVHLFEQGGEADTVQCLGVQKWGYDRGGFQVDVAYRVATPCMSADLLLTAIGMDSADDTGERQWYIKAGMQGAQPVLTDEGTRMTALSPRAHAFAQEWLNKVSDWQWEGAYLDTLPPTERQRQAKERGPQFAEGLKAFRAGAVVHADPETFWAGPRDKDKEKDRQRKEQAADQIRSIFGPRGENAQELMLPPGMPSYRREATHVRFGFHVVVPLGSQAMQAILVVAADVQDGEPGPKDWYVQSLDLISVKSSLAPSRPPGAPPPPAVRP